MAKLIERMTQEKFLDIELISIFLLTYRTVTTPVELLEKLILRYCTTAAMVGIKGVLKIKDWQNNSQQLFRKRQIFRKKI